MTDEDYSPIPRTILINVDPNNLSEEALDLTLINRTMIGEMRKICQRIQGTARGGRTAVFVRSPASCHYNVESVRHWCAESRNAGKSVCKYEDVSAR